MSLTLVTAPVYEAISVDELKSHLRITHVEEDPLLYTIARTAREMVEMFTSRRLITQTWDWRLDCFPSWCLLVPNAPFASVTSISYVDANGDSQTLSASDYEVDIYDSPGRIMPAYGESWPSTREKFNAVTIRFVCGYGTPVQVPKSLRQACLILGGHLYENRELIQAGTIIAKIPLSAEHLMWPYRVSAL